MTKYDTTPIAPPDLGAVLADPGAYAQAAIAGLTLPSPLVRSGVHRVRRPRRGRRGVAALVAVVAAACLALAGCAAPAQALTVSQDVFVASTVVHAPGHQVIWTRFRRCVYDVQAYALRGPVDDDYSAASNEHRGELRPGQVARLVMPFARADAGRWAHLIVTGQECGTAPLDWSHMITLTTAATFTVVAR